MKLSILILVNTDGDFVASHDADLLDELFDEHIGGTRVGNRTLTLELEIPEPKPIAVSVPLIGEPATVSLSESTR